MKISVVIPIYNNAKYLKQCIKSIIEQNENTEIILIDDCSSDNVEEIIIELKKEKLIDNNNFICIKNEKNIGPAESRNKGIMQASGEYIAFLDADDWWEPLKLSKQLELIKKHDGVLYYTSRKNIFESDGRTKDLEVKESLTYKELLKGNQIACSSVLVRKDIAKKYLMTKSEVHEDYYMWLRILKDYKTAYGINEPLLNYRIHSNSKSNNKIKSAIMTFKTIKLMEKSFIKTCFYFASYVKAGLKNYN